MTISTIPTTSKAPTPVQYLRKDDDSERRVLKQVLAAFQELIASFFPSERFSEVYEELIYAPVIGTSTVRRIRNDREVLDPKNTPLFIDYLTTEQQTRIISRIDRIIPIIRRAVRTEATEKELWLDLDEEGLV